MRDGCPFCDYEGPSAIRADHGDVFVIDPMNPVVKGHLLIIPKAHVSPEQPNPGIIGRAFEVAALEAEWAISRDYNLILSSGTAATQTVPHYHVHVVPRHAGDGLALPWDDTGPKVDE